ncbi:MAG: porphobilinogen synthase, partial [Bacteroidales bacterium]|nr:porphobilinogen synthase [Bacteroidales bacterium]
MAFPITRLRRLRSNPITRDMMRETTVSAANLIMPLFAVSGTNVKNPIPSMPGQYQMSIDLIVEKCKHLNSLGIKSVLL